MITAAEHNAMADFVNALLDTLPEVNFQELLISEFAKTFPDTEAADAFKVFEDVIARRDEEHEVKTAIWDAEHDLISKVLALGEGLPDHMEVGEVVRLRANQGNDFALWLLDHPEILSREIEIPAD